MRRAVSVMRYSALSTLLISLLWHTTSAQCNSTKSCSFCLEKDPSCAWCTKTGECIEGGYAPENCGTHGLITKEDSCHIVEDSNMTFLIVMLGLLSFCCSSCIIRQCAQHLGQERRHNSLNEPLLSEVNREQTALQERAALFQNSLLQCGEVTWLCFVCGFENWPRSTDCGLCGTSKSTSDSYHDKVASCVSESREIGSESIGKKCGILASGKAIFKSHLSRKNSVSDNEPLGKLSLPQRLSRRRHLWQLHAQLQPKEDQTKGEPGVEAVMELTWRWFPITDVVAKVLSQPSLHKQRLEHRREASPLDPTFASESSGISPSVSSTVLSQSPSDVPDVETGNFHAEEIGVASSINSCMEEDPFNHVSTQRRREAAYTPERNLNFNDVGKLKASKQDTLFNDAAMVTYQPAFVSVLSTVPDVCSSSATRISDCSNKEAIREKRKQGKPSAEGITKCVQHVYAGDKLRGLDTRDSVYNFFHPKGVEWSASPGGDNNVNGLYIEWVPAEEAFVPQQSVSLCPHDTVASSANVPPAANIFHAFFSGFHNKQMCFLDTIDKLQVPLQQGHIQLDVQRNQILADSFTSLMELHGPLLQERLRVNFIGEPGVDAGGLEREWFTLTAQELFDPNQGLFRTIGPLNALDFNPSSGLLNELDKEYFRFAGRLLAKALLEHQILPGRLAPYIYKHLIGSPMSLDDVEAVDEHLYRSLMWIQQNEGVASLALTFSVNQEGAPGGRQNVMELVPGGADKEVTDDNKDEFVALRVRHRFVDSIAEQLWHFKYGFHEILPPFTISLFDAYELELLLCGLPGIDVGDWKRHTDYGGEFASQRETHRVIRWFWDIVESLSQEERSKLLQFTTGTARVPARGFKALQSNDGNYRRFNIVSFRPSTNYYPRAHTCFNKLDLPIYRTKAQCEAHLRAVLEEAATGFSMD